MPQPRKIGAGENMPMHNRRWVFYVVIVLFFAAGIWIGYAAHKDKAEPAKIVPERPAELRTCDIIEQKKLGMINDEMDASPDNLAWNAEVYSDLVKYGCPENAAKFRNLALRQLEIADAMIGENVGYFVTFNDGNLYKTQMRVYKNLKEQGEIAQEARRIMQKAQRLGEPALEFISEIERILSE